jgi:predicted nucleic acid-binding protein
MKDVRTQYLDASALVKLLVDERHSQELRAYLHDSIVATTPLCFAETLGVLKNKWLRKYLTQAQYLSAVDELIVMIRDENLILEDIGFATSGVYTDVEHVAAQYSLDISDALQLVTLRHGFYGRPPEDSQADLVTADAKLAQAARAERLNVWLCGASE